VDVAPRELDTEAMTAERIAARLRELGEIAERSAAALSGEIARAASMIRGTVAGGGTLYFCGNGGSAADAQHLATEYVVRYRKSRPPMRAMALTTDSSLLTAAANDLGFDEVFARQVEAFVTPADLLIIHSTSGSSPNVLRAAHAARAKGVPVLAFTAGAGGRIRELATHTVIVPTDRSDRAQEMHLCIEHVICELVEDGLG
jgi:D-sedoheptulose 7-phosphate isomerase